MVYRPTLTTEQPPIPPKGGSCADKENITMSNEKDVVNHPNHYETGKFECIDVMAEVFGSDNLKEYCLINAFKYIYRCKRKGKEAEDVRKAIWYLTKYLELQLEEYKKSED